MRLRLDQRKKPALTLPSRVATIVTLGLAVGLGILDYMPQRALAQSSGQNAVESGAGSSNLDSQLDPYQRSGKIYYHKLMGKSGVERGKHIYYLKCWICHNEYAIESDPKNAAPTLKDIYSRPQLRSGKPVNDESLKAKIQDGGPGMPAYRHSINDVDMADLLTYLRGKCCWDAENPPANPDYKAK